MIKYQSGRDFFFFSTFNLLTEMGANITGFPRRGARDRGATGGGFENVHLGCDDPDVLIQKAGVCAVLPRLTASIPGPRGPKMALAHHGIPGCPG